MLRHAPYGSGPGGPVFLVIDHAEKDLLLRRTRSDPGFCEGDGAVGVGLTAGAAADTEQKGVPGGQVFENMVYQFSHCGAPPVASDAIHCIAFG